ncbi:MAG: hypothetical protein BWY76_03416 [bacterium ADurb.Bin429]|nr:MAG: hypothetical protein BWY76_03416 [bacterium ADurb.Bin429]
MSAPISRSSLLRVASCRSFTRTTRRPLMSTTCLSRISRRRKMASGSTGMVSSASRSAVRRSAPSTSATASQGTKTAPRPRRASTRYSMRGNSSRPVRTRSSTQPSRAPAASRTGRLRMCARKCTAHLPPRRPRGTAPSWGGLARKDYSGDAAAPRVSESRLLQLSSIWFTGPWGTRVPTADTPPAAPAAAGLAASSHRANAPATSRGCRRRVSIP